MRKKLTLIIAVIIMIIQLCVPAGLIILQAIETNSVEKKGQSYIFEARNFGYHNGKMNMYLLTDGEWLKMNDEIRYLIVDKDENGKTLFTATDKKPEGDNYIDNHIDRYDAHTFPNVFADTQIYENIDDIVLVKTGSVLTPEPDDNRVYYKDVTAEVRIYKGKIMVSEVYIDGVDSETYFEQLNNYYSN